MRASFHYGPAAAQAGELYGPADSAPLLVVLLHGGFWRTPHGRDQWNAGAEDLRGRGFAVANLGYRRLGEAGGGWPGTFEDVAAGLDYLGGRFAAARIVVVGHSAGGLLALWSAGRTRGTRPCAVAALAPITNLLALHASGGARGVAGELLEGSPDQVPDRYRSCSPHALLPLRVPQLILHGAADTLVPLAWSREYASAARACGDVVELTELPTAGHMDFLDPSSAAHGMLADWLERLR
ncbi:MAG TPA: prolyl oligopeptidase family serine peptidase [Telluria sp.]|nr:prolyl oligopeptidase family serine peptidase [Telluria sp.]